MTMRKSLLQWAGILVVFILVLSLCIEAKETSEIPEHRSDLITIDTLKSFDALERPKVVFLHDLHTEALEKSNKGCNTCHLSEKPSKDRLSLKFKRLEDTDKKKVMDIYHAECMGCHREISASNQDAGPVEVCGECHKERPLIKSSRLPGGFDKSLHYRHYKAQKNKCERCHHEYDQKSKKLIYAKDKEGTCRYCHKKETQELDSEKRISMRLASHFACIDCHMKNIAKNIDAGPVTCGGCHDIEQQKKIKKVDKIPRLKRKQPDIVLIKTGDKKGLKTPMFRVPFGHKAHERYNDTCRVCHHADLKSCAGCHTLTGSKEGQYVKLKDAMHQLDTKQSCMGCHELNQHNRKCAGCHAFLGKDRKQDSASCMKCHMAPPEKSTGVLYQAGERKLARMMPEIWKAMFGTKNDVDIPKKVVIKELVDRYEPVEFPHRKILQALKKKINNNKMATYFHPVEATLCQGCHHNSPAAGKPPKCGSCHGKPFNEKNLFMPGLKGAYHRQCMGCHNEMGIEKPANVDCAGCHVEKKKQEKEVLPDKNASKAGNKPIKTQG